MRTAKLNTRFILTVADKQINITDTEGNGKALPYMICYAEKIEKDSSERDEITQYVFNVQDYESIFGLNESKINTAKSNYLKFLDVGTEESYKISSEFVVEIPENERGAIDSIFEGNRKIANVLSKYNNEASNYSWDDVKNANDLSDKFLQVPFEFDEDEKIIKVTAESFEAWVSVIANTKKLAIASNEHEDKIASSRIAKAASS